MKDSVVISVKSTSALDGALSFECGEFKHVVRVKLVPGDELSYVLPFNSVKDE